MQDGHTIAMASYSNSYSKIYESTEAFTDDLTQISDYITNLTGIAPDIYRFPGGSMNQISNVDMVELVKILNSKHIHTLTGMSIPVIRQTIAVSMILSIMSPQVLPNMTIQLYYYMMIQTDQPRQRLLSRLLKA